MGCTESKSKSRKSRKLTKGSPLEIVVSITNPNASVKSIRSLTRLSSTKVYSLRNAIASDKVVEVRGRPTPQNPTFGSEKLLWLVDLKSSSKKRKGLKYKDKDKMLEDGGFTSKRSSLGEDSKSSNSIISRNISQVHDEDGDGGDNGEDDYDDDDHSAIEANYLSGIRSVQACPLLSSSPKMIDAEMFSDSDAGDVEFESSEKKSRSTGGNTGDQEELFNTSWDWVSDKEADAAAEACPIVMSDPIVSASHRPYDLVEVPPLPSSVALIPLVASAEQRVSDPTVGAEHDSDTTECPVVCSHPGSLTSPPDREVRLLDVSTADSALNFPATAPLTASGGISSDCIGVLQNNSSVMSPSPDKASVSKHSSPSSSSSCSSQYHITPLLSALLPTTIPPPPTTHRLSHSASSPLLLSVSTVTSYSSSVSPSNHHQKSEIAASSFLPSPLTSPSASIDGISLRRVTVKAVAATAIEPSHVQEASNMTPSAITIDVLQSIDVSSPVSTLSESSLPLSPYALFLARNAAQAAAAQPCLSSLSLSPPPAPVASARNAMLLTYEEEEAEYRAKHGTSWAPLSPTVYFSEPIEIDSKAWMNGNQNASRCGGHPDGGSGSGTGSGTGSESGADVLDHPYYDSDSESEEGSVREDAHKMETSEWSDESDNESECSIQSILTHENTVRNTVSNATTTMAPSAVITSQRNSVHKGWEREREKERETQEEALKRDRAVAGSMHSCHSNVEGMDEEKVEEERVAPTGKSVDTSKVSNALCAANSLPLTQQLTVHSEQEKTNTLLVATMTSEETVESREQDTAPQPQHLRSRSASLPPAPSCSLLSTSSSSALHIDTARCSTRGRSVSAVTLLTEHVSAPVPAPAPVPVPAYRVFDADAGEGMVRTDEEMSTTSTPRDGSEKKGGKKNEEEKEICLYSVEGQGAVVKPSTHTAAVIGCTELKSAVSAAHRETLEPSPSSSTYPSPITSSSSSSSCLSPERAGAEPHSRSLPSLPVAVAVQSAWSKQSRPSVTMPVTTTVTSIKARSRSLPCRNADWKGAHEEGEGERGVLKAEAVEVKAHVRGPTAAVSVSRLFFENKMKEIADSVSVSSSPRGSLTLPKREWGYSPYSTTNHYLTPPKRSVHTSQSLSNLDQSDECSTSTSTDAGRQRERGREVVSLGNFAERKAFFQGNVAGSGHILAASTANANAEGCPCSSAIPVCMRVRVPEGPGQGQGQRQRAPRQQHALWDVPSTSTSFSPSQQQREREKELKTMTSVGSVSGSGSEVCMVKSVRDIVRSWSSVVKESSVVKAKKSEIVDMNHAMTARATQLHLVRLNEVAIH